MKRATRQILNVELQQGMLLKMYFLKNHFAVERDAIERDTDCLSLSGDLNSCLTMQLRVLSWLLFAPFLVVQSS